MKAVATTLLEGNDPVPLQTEHGQFLQALRNNAATEGEARG